MLSQTDLYGEHLGVSKNQREHQYEEPKASNETRLIGL